LGVIFLPTEKVAVTFAAENIFGDVNGYGLTSAMKVSF
jgi:hypothetical protein